MQLNCENEWVAGSHRLLRRFAWSVSMFVPFVAQCASNVYLSDVPDYEWHVGCFGTATGNLMGYWDRHGFPNFYTGPTAYGVAPLTSVGDNYGIRSLWASQAGLDGRPADKPGHVDDYYASYASTDPDPYLRLGRTEHEPDCLGDFIGLNQNRWKNLNGECDGNIDNYSFVYWDYSGERRVNFTPGPEAGLPARDIQSGLREWTQYRGYAADVVTQLADVNPEAPFGKGFTFEDLKAEINAGYPVVMFLQEPYTRSRSLEGMARANPLIHGVLAYGYSITDNGAPYVRYRNSFAGGDTVLSPWSSDTLWGLIAPLRGVICYHPRPQITSITQRDGFLTIQWHGPRSSLYDVHASTYTQVHRYVVEVASSLIERDFTPVDDPTTDNKIIVPADNLRTAYYRLRLLTERDQPLSVETAD